MRARLRPLCTSAALRVLLAVVSCFGLATSGLCAAIAFTSNDELAGFDVRVARGPIKDTSDGDFGGGEAWTRTGTLREELGGSLTNDKVFVSGGSVVHTKAPHGEPPNAGNVFQF